MHELAIITENNRGYGKRGEGGNGLRKLALLRDASNKFEVSEEPPVVAEWDFEALVRSMGLSRDGPDSRRLATPSGARGRGPGRRDRDGLLGWCRDPPVLKDGATDDVGGAAPAAGARK